jgi:hypothetical protein
MTVSQAADVITPRRSSHSMLTASITGPLIWASLVATAAACFLFQAWPDVREWEFLGYVIGFAVASATAGVVVLTLRGRIHSAFGIGLPILILLVSACTYLWVNPPSFFGGVFPGRKDVAGSLVVGYAAGGAAGLFVGCIGATLAFLSARGRAWALAVLVALVTVAATRWPLGQVVEYAAALGFELSTPPRYNNQLIWYSSESIGGAAQGATLGAFAGAVLGGLAAMPRKQRGKPNG